MICALRAFLEFIYLARRDVHDTHSLQAMQDALQRFQKFREIFVTTGVRQENSTPPRQHSMMHYVKAIRLFGAPNGLCTSITESKHIKAVKEPWRRSNRYNALEQMLLINQRLDKLAAARVNFTKRGMLNGTALSETLKRLCMSNNYPYPFSCLTAHFKATLMVLMQRARLDILGPVMDETQMTTNATTNNNNNNNNDGGEVDGVEANPMIQLAKKPSRTLPKFCYCYLI